MFVILSCGVVFSRNYAIFCSILLLDTMQEEGREPRERKSAIAFFTLSISDFSASDDSR